MRLAEIKKTTFILISHELKNVPKFVESSQYLIRFSNKMAEFSACLGKPKWTSEKKENRLERHQLYYTLEACKNLEESLKQKISTEVFETTETT